VVTPRRVAAKRWARVTLCGVIGLAAPAGGSESPPCLAEAAFERERATVGQQIRYQLLILSRADVTQVAWSEPPSFPGFRAEWLPGRPAAEAVVRDGVRYSARSESRALFPEHAGELRAAPPDLRCRLSSDAGERTFLAPVPALTLRAVAPPADGRPNDFSGLIGPITLQTIVTPRELSLGDTVRVAVMLRGPGNLWEAPEPLGAVADAEIFRRRPELTLETGPQLVLKRHFAYDVVPLRVGVLAIPGARVAYFDPATGSYAVAASEPVEVAVGARVETDPASEPATVERGDIGEPDSDLVDDTGRTWPWWPTVAVLLVAAVAVLTLRWRLRAIRAAAEFESGLAPVGAGEDEAAALARALRNALARHLPNTPALTAEEIAARDELPPAVAEAARLLAAAERARFDPTASAPSREAVARAIARL